MLRETKGDGDDTSDTASLVQKGMNLKRVRESASRMKLQHTLKSNGVRNVVMYSGVGIHNWCDA